MNEELEIENILKSASRISYHYNASVLMPEHILSFILSLDNFYLRPYLDSIGITNNLISKFICNNKKEKNYQDITFDPQTKKVLFLTNKFAKEKNKNISKELIVLTMFKIDYDLDIITYFSQNIEDFNANAISKHLEKLIMEHIETIIDEKIFEFGKNLNNEYKNGLLKKSLGRESEINKIVEGLLKISSPNCILHGEVGVGKTSTVNKLVENICEGKIYEGFKNKCIMCLDNSKFLTPIHTFEINDKIQQFFDLCNKNLNVIVLIDDLYTFSSSNNSGLNDSLKLFLKTIFGKIKNSIILVLNEKEYSSIIENDVFFKNKFSAIEILPTSIDETVAIIKDRKNQYYNHYLLSISDECIKRIVNMADKYVKAEYFPTKALTLIESAFSKYSRNYGTVESNKELLIKYENEYENSLLINEKQEKIDELKHKLEIVKTNIKRKDELDLNTIDMVFSEKLNIPTKKLLYENSEKFSNLEESLLKNIVGHDEIIKKVCDCIKRNRQGYIDDNKPIGSFLFLGPSGIGKTELAKNIAMTLFDDEKNIIQLNMAEFSDTNSISRILGHSLEVSGYNESGYLVTKINNMPYCVLLLDDIEKASEEVINLFLHILDNGVLTDNSNKTAYFSNVIVIMTSNCGINNLDSSKKEEILQVVKDMRYEEFLLNEFKKIVNVDIVSHFNEVLYFKPITNIADRAKFIKIQLEAIIDKIKVINKLDLKFTENSIYYINKICAEQNQIDGFRPISKLLNNNVLNVILSEINKEDISKFKIVTYDYENNQIKIRFK